MQTNWLFPHGENLTKTGHNNSSIEAFLDNIGKSLTREVIQNSLDAKNNINEKPVYIKFNEFFYLTSEIPGIDKIKNFALPKAKEMWKGYNETYEFLTDFEKVINQEKIPVMQISDYNTTGLNDENFESLIEGNNFSTKNSIDSAGSKGIGKAAPFAASDLRMVFYNSNSVENGIKSTGVVNFVSFPVDDRNENDITQERGILKSSDGEYLKEQLTLSQKQREPNEYGTDIFLIGLKQLGNWKENIVRAILNNFLVSIFKNELEVEVYGELINSETVGQILENIDTNNLLQADRTEFIATQNYYKVLVSEEAMVSYLPEQMVDKYDFIDDVTDGTLYLLNVEPANRKILQTRKAGMKIYERGYVNSIINFTGIFQATGIKLNKFLKDLENANHDKWSVDRKQGKNRNEAQNLLTDLLHWFQNEVKSNYGVTTDEIHDAIGVNDLLPIQDTGDGEKNIDSGIKNKFSSSKVKESIPKSSISDGDKIEDTLLNTLDELGYDYGEEGTSGPGSERSGDGGGDNPDNEFGGGDQPGDFVIDVDSEDTVISEVLKPIGNGELKFKLLGFNYQMGEYQLVGRAIKDINKLKMHFKSIGDNGSTYNIRILNSESKKHEVTNTSKEVKVHGLKKDDQLDIKITIDSKLKLKMEVVMHEVKS